ncbi:MAG: hypothetical protein Q9216_003860 [Gyalolechia sp. 2 TL-2023]
MSAIFEGCVIVLSGDLTEKITLHNGSVSKTINNKTTHLVASQKDIDHESAKVSQAAKNPQIKTVSIQWLMDSVLDGEKNDEEAYEMEPGTPANPVTKNTSTTYDTKKRALYQSTLEVDEPATKKQRGEQYLGHQVEVPLDARCVKQLPGSWKVWTDQSGLIYDATLNQSNISNNNNKFYVMQLVQKDGMYHTWTRWGRVGVVGQWDILGAGDLEHAKVLFEKKFKEKTGLLWTDRLDPPRNRKYTFVERTYSDELDEKANTPAKTKSKEKQPNRTSRQPASKLHESVQALMQLIFNEQYFDATLHEMAYDTERLPLGNLSKRTLMLGYECLKELGEVLSNADIARQGTKEFQEELEELTNRYYTAIPHSFETRLKRELALIESLGDMEIANEITTTAKAQADDVHLLDRKFAGLGLDEIIPLRDNTREFQEIASYLTKTKGHTHYFTFNVQHIFRISRHGEAERFRPYGELKNSDRRLLWHGSRSTNFAGILSQGLRIAPPEAPVSGYMFGKGVYLADMSTKSANYCYSELSDDTALLLLCEAELGEPRHELIHANCRADLDAKKGGKISVFGKGFIGPPLWKDARCIHPDLKGVLMPDTTLPPTETGVDADLEYNEYIVYDVAQIRLRVISRHQQTRLTYDELDRMSNALASGLQDLGVGKGDRIATDEVKATYAIFKLGAVLVPLNPAFNAQQVIAALNHLEASHLLIGAETNLPRKSPRSNVSLIQQIIPDIQGKRVQSEAVPSLTQIVMVENSNSRVDSRRLQPVINYQDILKQSGSSKPTLAQSLSADDIVNIQFTSGTTSMPKAACLTHRSILNNGKSIGDRMLLTEQDIVCCPPPLFHCFGCILGYMATATHGSAIVFPAEAFDPYATLKSVQDEKCTALYGVPTMFIADLELLQNGTVPYTGFEHLRTGIAAGSSIPAELMRKLHKILNLTELTICYGMTETSPVSAMTTTDDPIEKRIDSVGRPLPHIETKIVDPMNRSKILPIGSRGELAVSGYLVMKEYWGNPDKTAEVMLPDDTGKIWMHTGDEAEMDADGYLKITGRIKDIIIRGGENIHPLEIENCLLGHPKVAEASVVGLPDERYGEAVAAFVVRAARAELSADEVRTWWEDSKVQASRRWNHPLERREGHKLMEQGDKRQISSLLGDHSLLSGNRSSHLLRIIPHQLVMKAYTSLLVPFILSFPASTGSTPQQASRNTSVTSSQVHVLGDPDPLLDDPCGPPNVPRTGTPGSKSTCAAVVAEDLPAESPFRLSCQTDGTGFVMNWETCQASVNAACAALVLATNPPVDRWVWAPPSANEGDTIRPNCSVGFWNPSNGALLPDYDRCRRDILNRMVEGCAATRETNVAAVNLAKLPRRTLTERFTGEAVNVGYPKFGARSGNMNGQVNLGEKRELCGVGKEEECVSLTTSQSYIP